MKYVLLLRGINVGGHRKVEMKRLKSLLESLGYSDVKTYLNTGNIFFQTAKKQIDIQKQIPIVLAKEFGFEIQSLVKTQDEVRKITEAIPSEWTNDSEQKSDIAYLFPEIDSVETIDLLPIKKEFVDIQYVQGALIWTVNRKNYNKSHMNKLASHKYYQLMTIRNVNTARYIGSEVEKS